MRRLRSPFVWFGGKGKMLAKLLKLMPPHEHYVEPFCGSAALFFAKEPCGGVETLNDLNSDIVNFFRVLRDEALFERFYRKAVLTPYSREEYDYACSYYDETTDPVERAYLWWVVARMSFGGRFGAKLGTVVTKTRRGMAGTTSAFLSIVDLLPQIAERLRMAQIEHADFRVILRRYCGPGYLAYCDPPYVGGTRRGGEYAHEMTDDDHRDLVRLLLDYDGAVMLSGYPNEVYRPLEDAGWTRYDFQTACHAAGRTRASNLQGEGAALKHQPRTECVWLNPEAERCRGQLC